MRLGLRTRAHRPGRAGARASALCLCALAAAGCGDTVQSQPVSHNALETLLVAPYPVYWLGRSFRGLHITEVSHDASGAFSVQYGTCLVGGQGTCVPPLRVVTSPDNSFLPLGQAPHSEARLRGVAAVLAEGGRTIELATGGVVVSVYGHTAPLAAAAARTAVPINAPGTPGAQLAARLPDTGFGERPLPAQLPSPLLGRG
jgi:hypothetical protein